MSRFTFPELTERALPEETRGPALAGISHALVSVPLSRTQLGVSDERRMQKFTQDIINRMIS